MNVIKWDEETPEGCKGEVRYEELEGEPGWVTGYDIYLRESEFGAFFYSLEASYINDDHEYSEQHIADFKSLKNAKLFAELIEPEHSHLVEDITNNPLWLTNMGTNK